MTISLARGPCRSPLGGLDGQQAEQADGRGEPQVANGDRWADVIDMLTMYPKARHRAVVRQLAEIAADD